MQHIIIQFLISHQIDYIGKLNSLQIGGGKASDNCNCELDQVWLFYNYDLSSKFSSVDVLIYQLMMADNSKLQ